MTSFTKRCTSMRRVCWCKFGRNPMKSFCLICVLVSLSWIPRQSFFPDFACLSIYTFDTSPDLFVCLSIYENAKTLSHSSFLQQTACTPPFVVSFQWETRDLYTLVCLDQECYNECEWIDLSRGYLTWADTSRKPTTCREAPHIALRTSQFDIFWRNQPISWTSDNDLNAKNQNVSKWPYKNLHSDRCLPILN